MAARDGASSINGTWMRVTKLTDTGEIQAGYPVLSTQGFMTASFSPVFEDGDEINEKAADGSVCVTWKNDDTLTRLDFALSVCSQDPEITAMLSGGAVVKDEDENIIGYSSMGVGDVVGSPLAVEIWSIANLAGKPAVDQPYWHWVFPYVKIRYDGDREFANGRLANEFSGRALGNDALTDTGLNPINPTDDFVIYRDALVNPFTYVRTTGQPDSDSMFSGSYPASGASYGPA